MTARKGEVLRLLAEGLSDQEIAAALFVSRRTVGVHVTNLLGKLGVESRTAAAAFAFRNGLV
ncbi:MAG: response regulator transcription factor [Thermomicrobiales bacterium]